MIESIILRWTSFLIIPVSTLYDEYIDRPKLSEQKNPFVYIVPLPPQEGSERLIFNIMTSIYATKDVVSKFTYNEN